MFFRDIPGQNEIKENLRKTVHDSRISHAQMFFGPEGSGKLALALAFARYIFCTNPGEDDACGTCPSCIKVSKLIHPDLHFVFPTGTPEKKSENKSENKSDKKDDATADNTLEKWREALIENPFIDQHQWYEKIGIENKQGLIGTKESSEIIRKLNLKPYEADYKILIMWLPERMNSTAANKLLKMVEEPPPGTVFLLVSESVGEVLPTIQSRTQMIKIPRLKDEDVRAALKIRFNIENQKVEDAVKVANGDFNKALNSIKADELNKYNFEQFVSFMRSCYSINIPELMDCVEELSKTGRERQKLFLTYGMRILRENFLVNTGHASISHMAKYEDEWSVKFSRFINKENIFGLYEEFNTACNHISANAYARIVFLDLGLKVVKLIKKDQDKM
jgi:DNA polymerase III subunit delta'